MIRGPLPEQPGGPRRAGRGLIAALVVGAALLVMVVLLVVVLVVPMAVRFRDSSSRGLVWQTAGGTDRPHYYVPAATVGDAIVMRGSEQIVIISRADGTVRGEISADGTERIIQAGDRIVVEHDHRFQLYTAAGVAGWPEPVAATEILARGDGVTAFWQCQDPVCTLTGFDDAGRVVWQKPAPRSGGGLHIPRVKPRSARGLPRLPDRLALRERSGYAWRVLAATGKPLGTHLGEVAHLTAGATVSLRYGGRPGRCELTLDRGPKTTVRAIACGDPRKSFIRGRMLVVPTAGSEADLHPLDREGEPVHVRDAGPLLQAPYPDSADDTGMAQLVDGELRGWAWPITGPIAEEPDWTARHPSLTTTYMAGPGIVVGAGTVVVTAPAARRTPLDSERDSFIAVYRLTDGTETARIRISKDLGYPVRPTHVLPITPGCAIVGLEHGQALLGTC